jgi:transcriptional regulator
MPPRPKRIDLLQGTLDMLVLRTLLLGPRHGQAIVESIRQSSQDALLVDAGSLYPALHRLLARDWIAAQWDKTAAGRRAKFYTLTQAGRKQLQSERSRWERLVEAIGLVLNPSHEEA